MVVGGALAYGGYYAYSYMASSGAAICCDLVCPPNATSHSECRSMKEVTCNELCEYKGYYNGSYIDTIPMRQDPLHKEEYLVPDYSSKLVCNDDKQKSVGCGKDCIEKQDALRDAGYTDTATCCCN